MTEINTVEDIENIINEVEPIKSESEFTYNTTPKTDYDINKSISVQEDNGNVYLEKLYPELNQQNNNNSDLNFYGDTEKTKNKLINIIENNECINANVRKIKYPPTLNYKYGDNLRNYDIENLQKIIKIQNSLSGISKFSAIGTLMIIQGTMLLEKYVESLNGYSGDLIPHMKEIEECLQEILLDVSDEVEMLTSPYARLAMIFAMAGISTYSKNQMSSPKPKSEQKQNVETPTVQRTVGSDEPKIFNQQTQYTEPKLPVKRGPGRPKGSFKKR